MKVEGVFCAGCPMQDYGEQFVTFDGSGASKIMFVGESPFTYEVAAKRPFAGPAGYIFDRILHRVGLERDDVLTTNSAWCKAKWRGFYDHPERWHDAQEAMEHCRPHLDGLIERMRPKVLVPMGNVALRRVCGVSGIEDYAGYVLPTEYGIPAVPTFHPSYIMQGKQKLSPAVIFAINRAREIARDGFHPEPPVLLLDPTPEQLLAYCSLYSWDSVFLDLETPEKAKRNAEDDDEMDPSYTILRASFSLAPNTGVSFPWQEPYIGILQKLLDVATETVEWATNHYDTKRLVAAGLRVPERRVSAQWAWHWLQSDLPKALGRVAPYLGATTAWKHLNRSEPAYYSAMDSLEGRRCWLGIRKTLQEVGRWESFERHCTQSDPILVRMGRAGVLIDPVEKVRFMGVLKAEHAAAYAELQTVVPEEVRPVKYWKRPPKDMTGVVAIGDVLATPGLFSSTAVEKLAGVLQDAEVQKWASAIGYRYRRIENFNPNSPDQVQALAKALKVKLPKKRDAEDDDDQTTERKYLLAASRKHRAFRLVLDCRERSKLLSTYDWPLDARGRVTTVFGWHPSTLRKSSRSVNLQNIPKRSALAKQFRTMIVAAPGCLLVEADWSAIEAVLVGYFARSDRYIRLAKAGIHGWLTAALHGQDLPIDAPDLAAQCRAAKVAWPDDYEKMKRVIHMSNYLGTPIRMAEEYPDDFPTVAAARKLQNFYFSTEPGQDVRRWQHEVVMRADHDCYLDNPFRYRHWFYEATVWDRKTETRKPGEDAKRAVADLPQSTASAVQTECLLRLAAYPELLEWLRLIVHDSFLCEVPEERVSHAGSILYYEMTAPIPELGGLEVGVELSCGRNWGPYDAEKNPGGMKTFAPEPITRRAV